MGEWTEDGKQHRRSMGTADEGEAAAKLIALRAKARAAKALAKPAKGAKGPEKKTAAAPPPEDLAAGVEAHIARKRRLEGKRGGFTESSAANMHYAMAKFSYFVEFQGAPSPPPERGKKKTRKKTQQPKNPLGRAAIVFDISDTSIERFYSWLLETEKLAEETAKTYVTRVRTFGLSHGLKLAVPPVERGSTRRRVVFSAGQVNLLLANVESHEKDPERAWALRFIIFCGCICGMRKAEISMCRPSWFDLPAGGPGHLRIPRDMEHRGGLWRTKAKKTRPTEIANQFRDFLLESRQRWKDRIYMLSPEADGRRYRYDFRRPLLRYFESHGFRTNLRKQPKDPSANIRIYNIHAMRHTFATLIAQHGVSAPRLSAALGVTARTAEGYTHAGVDAATLTEALGGKGKDEIRHEETIEQLAQVRAENQEIRSVLKALVEQRMQFAAQMGRPISFAQALQEISSPQLWRRFAEAARDEQKN